MPVQIGQAEPGFEDPVGLMTACHRRIERFLAALCRVTVDCKGGALEGAHRSAFETSLRYFRDAAPHHTEDEEQGLFPAVQSLAPGESPGIPGLEHDHRRAEELHAEVDRIGLEWLREGTLTEPQVRSITAALDELTSIYAAHIRVEEEQVFPLARRVLPNRVLEVIGREMAARRGIEYIGKSGQTCRS